MNQSILRNSQLFRLSKDPNERYNIARQHPQLVQQLFEQLLKEKNVSRGTVRLQLDQRGNPWLLNGTYSSYWC